MLGAHSGPKACLPDAGESQCRIDIGIGAGWPSAKMVILEAFIITILYAAEWSQKRVHRILHHNIMARNNAAAPAPCETGVKRCDEVSEDVLVGECRKCW